MHQKSTALAEDHTASRAEVHSFHTTWKLDLWEAVVVGAVARLSLLVTMLVFVGNILPASFAVGCAFVTDVRVPKLSKFLGNGLVNYQLLPEVVKDLTGRAQASGWSFKPSNRRVAWCVP